MEDCSDKEIKMGKTNRCPKAGTDACRIAEREPHKEKDYGRDLKGKFVWFLNVLVHN